MSSADFRRYPSVFFSILLLIPAASQAQLVRVGAAGAVRGNITALAPAPGAVARIMSSGKPVYFNDKVKSGPDGRMQVMLLDETVFTLGPNSEMSIDKFVYNPATGVGKVSARVTKGVFRFVTGKIAKDKPSNMQVKLPVGVIGIRGTIVVGEVTETESLVVLAGPGKANRAGENAGGIGVTNAGETQNVDTPGFGTVVKPGAAPTTPFLVPAARMVGIDNALGTKPADGSKKGAGGGGAAGKGSPNQDSGQGTAGALGSLDNTESLSNVSENLGNETNQAAVDASEASGGIANGQATWDEVRGVAGRGPGHYYASVSGGFELTTCGGGSCANDGTGSMFIQLNIDFTNRTYGGVVGGGGSSFVSIFDTDTNAGGAHSDSVTIAQTPFTALSGNAQFSAASANTSIAVSLMNSDGVVANGASASASYTNGNNSGSGSITAPYFNTPIP